MQTFTAQVLDRGKDVVINRGWRFSHSHRSGRNEFNIHDMEGRTRFFGIQSLQLIGDGVIENGFYRRQMAALARDEYPETNRHSVLVALVADGYLDIPQEYFLKRMIKTSPILRNGNLAMVVVHLRKNEHMSFCVRNGNQMVNNLTLMYNPRHDLIELYDRSKELVMHDSQGFKSRNPLTRIWGHVRSLVSFVDPRTVR
jgi:hypothetical protein